MAKFVKKGILLRDKDVRTTGVECIAKKWEARMR